MDGLEPILAFLAGIGLPARRVVVSDDSFLPGIALRADGVDYDPGRLISAGDLLHEAGHLAVLPADRRRLPLVDDPSTEAAAIAWSWAACCHLGLPAELLFHAGGYRGQAAALRMSCELGVVPGWHLLVSAGLAEPVPPAMRRWLRD